MYIRTDEYGNPYLEMSPELAAQFPDHISVSFNGKSHFLYLERRIYFTKNDDDTIDITNLAGLRYYGANYAANHLEQLIDDENDTPRGE